MAQSGDHGLAELVSARGRDLTAYAYLLCGDRAAAQDLVQDAIVKVFGRTRAGFVPDVAEAYVRRTMLTLYIDGYRRRRTWAGVRHLVAEHHVYGSPEASVVDRVDLRAALRTLAPQERATVVLRFYEDLTVPEIAERMGLAPGSVKRYLSNALHRLEAQLGPMPDLQLDDTIVVDVPRRVSVIADPEGGRL
ncbi:sigma-70 family RNA polymerase sigma factor [Cellulomonas sp. KRMCY2]|uniref:sigma-70 family RNA polymerase sigma factor n=1 Tax=Cellulomonas sp. KRMCY2 TaxID=1304865 RepID=UPI00045EABA1|nr:sigma-70 family RNA polymerase sigma factor [Cellulomonas sp. KRMCY2]